MKNDPFGVISTLDFSGGDCTIWSLQALERAGVGEVSRLPLTIRILLEAALRNLDGFRVTEDHVRALASWSPETTGVEIPFLPSRVLLQDFTGVPAIVDLAAMRSAVERAGLDPSRINPQVPVDLVIDHSVQVDAFGTLDAVDRNIEREFGRNRERYTFIRWGQQAFDNFRVVPPRNGIVHQVNLEYLAGVVVLRESGGRRVALPDSLVGTDSHTTMINGLGVLGWGVGGIEAEAVMLGQPIYMPMPAVVGVELTGRPRPGVTATDLVLAVTQRLREHGVVGKFVEYYGEGLDALGLPDRATLANMAPEYGATTGFFPIDRVTLDYLRLTGRPAQTVELVERYARQQNLYRPETPPVYSETLSFDLGEVEPAIAGPRRPQDRIPLSSARESFLEAMEKVFHKPLAAPEAEGRDRWNEEGGGPETPEAARGSVCDDRVCTLQVSVRTGRLEECRLTHGAVVIAAITSCTNTSNPALLVGAGILAKKAVERGLAVKPWVKTSLAPGSRVVTRYLEKAGLMPYLQALRFHVVGYGCTTCIGNSGPLPPAVAEAVRNHDLVAAAVLSGNRNFEGRISPLVKANYLASPPLVIAYALAGTMNIRIDRDPVGHDPNGNPVYLEDLWPTADEIREAMASVEPAMFEEVYETALAGGPEWQAVPAARSLIYDWMPDSTYIREPAFFRDLPREGGRIEPIRGARVLALLGDSVTTDHISPAGAIPEDSPAGRYLIEQGVQPRDFNSFGSRRGNHEVMVRGTFGNIRLRNRLAPGTEGGYTTTEPGGEVTSIYEAAMAFQEQGTPLLVVAGREYGTGSSRDWAAKGTRLLGVRAVIAESYERIHRSNLVGMGVLPLEFEPGEGAESLGLTGYESFDIEIPGDLKPGQTIEVTATAPGGETRRFRVRARLDSEVDVVYYRNGGILQSVLLEMMKP